jgi:hypothetical protein
VLLKRLQLQAKPRLAVRCGARAMCRQVGHSSPPVAGLKCTRNLDLTVKMPNFQLKSTS